MSEDEIFDALVSAYAAGALDVHRNWQEDRDPDFSEAARDYARSAIATEARRAETENTGSVHEGADPKGIAHD